MWAPMLSLWIRTTGKRRSTTTRFGLCAIAAIARAKGVMHGHAAHVVVFLTSAKTLIDQPGGKTFISVRKKGDAISVPAGEHAPENLLDESVEVILVERK